MKSVRSDGSFVLFVWSRMKDDSKWLNILKNLASLMYSISF